VLTAILNNKARFLRLRSTKGLLDKKGNTERRNDLFLGMLRDDAPLGVLPYWFARSLCKKECQNDKNTSEIFAGTGTF
jgi:hypothetical protein